MVAKNQKNKKTTIEKQIEKKEEKERQQKNNLELFELMCGICKDWEDVEIGTTSKYIKLMVKEWKMFGEVTLTGKCLKVITLEVIEGLNQEWKKLDNGISVRKVPDNFGWVLNTEFKISNEEQLFNFMEYLKLSYQKRFQEKEYRKSKEERLKELNRKRIIEPVIFDNGRKSLGQLKLEMRKARRNYKNGKISREEAINIITPYIERQYELCNKRYNEFKEICKSEELTIKIGRPVKLKIKDLLK